jgi:hypothetical protein
VNRERPVARSDGADEGAELVRAEQEIEAHRAILTLDRHAVKPAHDFFISAECYCESCEFGCWRSRGSLGSVQ